MVEIISGFVLSIVHDNEANLAQKHHDLLMSFWVADRCSSWADYSKSVNHFRQLSVVKFEPWEMRLLDIISAEGFKNKCNW